MICQIIRETREALKQGLYFIALNSALTLPDICGSVEYPEKKTGERYINWYDEQIGKYEKCSKNPEIPYPDGKMIYKLRCALLHEGKPSIEKYHEEDNKMHISHFALIIEKSNDFDIYGDSYVFDENSKKVCEYRMNVQRICILICHVAEMYYQENQDKFQFNCDIFNV